jgi:phospholipid N-methyltransferase
VIEIGAGTGAVTRQLGEAIGPGDSIVICEMQQRLANVLESTVLKAPAFDQARREGRLVVHACAVQALPVDEPFDYAVCGLPFTAFCPKDIREIFRLVRGMLKPGGVFSYFEYVGMRRLRMALSMGEERKKMRRVSAVLDRHIRMYEWRRTFVARNFPPAYARHWRFDETAIPAQTGRRVQTARSFKA